MKSLIILIGLICLTQTTLSENCLEYTSLFNRREIRMVHCPLVSHIDKRAPSDDMFKIDFTCSVNDKDLCNKVKNVFTTAGKYITATINFKSVVNVKAKFMDFCVSLGECSNGNSIILGAAGPARFIPHQDPTDNKVRYYPQALYKQLNLQGDRPALGPYDITAMFNSNMNYWFAGDPLPLINQADMLYVVVHELIHGLGFIDSWNDYFNLQALTPAMGNMTQTTSQMQHRFLMDGSATLTAAEPKFFELVFDRSLVLLPSGKPVTSITDELNQFPIDASLTDQQFITSFKASPQFPIAQDMYKQAMTRNAIGFLTNPNLPLNTSLNQDQIQNNFVVLETSLIPFQQASSIAHVDLRTYLNSSDFLMIYTYPKVTLDQMMSEAGSTTTTGPIGPKLRLVLGTLGYDIKKDYTPPSITNNSSLISFNLVLSLGCVLLTLIYNIYF